MNKLIVLALIILTGCAQSRKEVINEHSTFETTEIGINFFHGSWEEALALAEKENKLIFLDAYASWCGPCKMMARTTFMEKEVGDYFNENFINFKMDMEKHAEGPRLSNALYLTAYPTLYFLNSTEKPIYKTLGYLKAKQLISEGKKALEI
jgi:thioredoxin 1